MTITVAGAMALQYLPHLMICPSFAAVAIPTTFAEAPMGVALPPISVPMANAQERTVISIPGVVAARLVITGIIVAANGILSMKALATAGNDDDNRNHQSDISAADFLNDTGKDLQDTSLLQTSYNNEKADKEEKRLDNRSSLKVPVLLFRPRSV